MTEVLTRFPDTTETETQFEQFDQLKTEELLFPKLDGILLPIVIDNADVIAPCEWMGGTEVSLSLALNNYYRPMTEENADEIIAEVYGFLAGQCMPEIVIEQESDYAVEPMATIAPQLESVDDKERTNTIDEVQTYIPSIRTELTEDVEVPTKTGIDAQEEAPIDKTIPRQALPASGQRDMVFASQVDDALQPSQRLENSEEKELALEALPLTRAQDRDTASTSPASMKPHVLEVEHNYVINHAPHSESPIELQEIFSADIRRVPVSPHPIDQVIERIDTIRDKLSMEGPLADAENDVESPSAEDEDVRAHEESMEYEQLNAEEHLDESDHLNAEKAPLEVTRETEPTTSGPKTIMEIDSLLDDARQPTEIDETNETETAKGFAEIIADMPASLELDDDSIDVTVSEATLQEELAALYTELIDGSPFNHRDRFIHLLAVLTIESQDSRENDVPAPAAAIHTKVKSLKVVIKSLRQTGNRMVAIGRLALKSHAMTGAVKPSVEFYILGARS